LNTDQRPPPSPDEAKINATTTIERFSQARETIKQKLVGHDRLIERLLVAVITGGHVLIEGSPGLAKTRTVNTFANVLSADFARIQATPDLLPADLTGTNIYDQNKSSFTFTPGPLFNNVVLVDEINRAPPKVQSALLEAMGEQQITAAGKTYELDDPFMVVATQNPIEHEGTYPLPEAQLDRFMFFVHVAMPDPSLELKILDVVLNEPINSQISMQPTLLQREDIKSARDSVQSVYISTAIKDYIVRLVTATRGYGNAGAESDAVEHPASPRGSIFLARAAQAHAWLNGRDHITPDDVAALAPDILSGRIILSYQAQSKGTTARQIIERILDGTAIV